ncbi:hypothetical protein MRX96_040462 [Rhipicephalus microplus]
MIVRKREVMERMFRLTLPKTEEKPSSTSIHTRQIKKFGKETDAGRKFQTNCTAVKRTPALFLVRAQSTRDTVVWDYLLDDKDRTDYEDSADEDAEARIHYRRNRHSSGPLSGGSSREACSLESHSEKFRAHVATGRQGTNLVEGALIGAYTTSYRFVLYLTLSTIKTY